MDNISVLVEQAQRGDSAAFGKLVRQFHAMAVGYGYAQLNDWQLAEDAAQEAFLYAYRSLGQLREPAAFPGWLRRIVQGQIGRIQRKNRLPTLHWEAVSDAVAANGASASTPEMPVPSDELFAAIDNLPESQRTVVALFYIGEHSQQAISAFLDIPVATVKTRLHYARKRLKERLSQEQGTLIGSLSNVLREDFPEQVTTTKVMRLFQAIIDDDGAAAQALLSAEPELAHAKGLEWSDFWHGEVAAIHLAVIQGRKAMIDLLLTHGADINQRETSNFTVLHFVANMALAGVISPAEADELCDFLTARGAKPDIGFYLWRGDLEAVRTLLASDPRRANEIGVMHATPLCHVIDIDAARLLLDYGADPFFQLAWSWGNQGVYTPMRWAASRPEIPHLFRFLLDYTHTPIDIHIACALGDVERVEQLLGADPKLLESRTDTKHVLSADFTPLHVAARYRQAEVAQLLLERGANPDAATGAIRGMTPLHLAVMYSAGDEDDVRIDVPQLLLAHGADMTIRDSARGLTPLEWAEGKYMADEKGRTAVIALLRQFESSG